jgi:rhodanese-related sulfurtransferase
MNHYVILVVALAAAYVVWRLLRLCRPSVDPKEAAQAVADGTAVLVDVREPAEWHEGVATPANLLPLSDLRGPRRQWRQFLEMNRDRRILLYCQSGGRSGLAATLLQREGFTAANLGGFHRWEGGGLPVRHP